MKRFAFTMIELIFVIVVMGIIGKFGVEFLAQAYKSFIFSSVNNSLQANSEMAVESIASRLQYRIKDSVIGRRSDNFAFESPETITVANGFNPRDYDILEWVATDIEGHRGNTLPNWSGIIDLRDPLTSDTNLVSPETNTTAINNLIQILADNPASSTTNFNDSAIFFIGADSDIKTGYGWDANMVNINNIINTQNGSMHPVTAPIGGQANRFAPTVGNFNGVDVYEYYQLAWTAYAVGIADYNVGANAGKNVGTLTLWYDYQPWQGERYTDITTKSAVLMENVSTFQYKTVGSIIKIQVCTNSDLVEDYSLCKEKTVF